MAQIINTICDVCFHEDATEAEALETVRVQVNGRAVEVDCCENHRALLDENVRPFFEVGRRPEKAALPKIRKQDLSSQPTHNHVCEVEGCSRSFPTKQGLSMHKTRGHGIESNTPSAKQKREAKASKASKSSSGKAA